MSGRAPRRWLDSADAPIGARELLSAAKPTRAMPDVAFERGLVRVAKTTAAPVAVAAGVTLWVKLAAAGVAVATVALGATALHVATTRDAERAERALSSSSLSSPVPARDRDAIPDPPSLDPVPVPVPVPVPAATLPTSASPSAFALPSASASASPSASASASPPSSTLLSELPLLERARRSLSTDPSSSLEALREHRAQFPSGVLAAERDLLEIDAWRRTGRTEAARAAADAWLARDPSGVYAARVRAIRSTLGEP